MPMGAAAAGHFRRCKYDRKCARLALRLAISDRAHTMDPLKGGGMMRYMLFVAAAFLTLTEGVRAETALQATASCREIAKGIKPNGQIAFTSDGNFCWGAFAVIQQLSRVVGSSNDKMLHICAGENVTRSQMILVFLKYADNHPEQLDEEFPFIALQALVQAFPCHR